MRVAALYDVHGNLPALEAVLADPRCKAADAIVCGGDLVAGPLPHTGAAWPPNERRIRAQRVVKFGILGSDMPGHETLEDEEVAALSGFVLQLRQEGIPKSP